jgi:hypothetical protein
MRKMSASLISFGPTLLGSSTSRQLSAKRCPVHSWPLYFLHDENSTARSNDSDHSRSLKPGWAILEGSPSGRGSSNSSTSAGVCSSPGLLQQLSPDDSLCAASPSLPGSLFIRASYRSRRLRSAHHSSSSLVSVALSTPSPYYIIMTTFQVVAVVVHAVLLVGFVGAFAYLFDLV